MAKHKLFNHFIIEIFIAICVIITIFLSKHIDMLGCIAFSTALYFAISVAMKIYDDIKIDVAVRLWKERNK